MSYTGADQGGGAAGPAPPPPCKKKKKKKKREREKERRERERKKRKKRKKKGKKKEIGETGRVLPPSCYLLPPPPLPSKNKREGRKGKEKMQRGDKGKEKRGRRKKWRKISVVIFPPTSCPCLPLPPTRPKRGEDGKGKEES